MFPRHASVARALQHVGEMDACAEVLLPMTPTSISFHTSVPCCSAMRPWQQFWRYMQTLSSKQPSRLVRGATALPLLGLRVPSMRWFCHALPILVFVRCSSSCASSSGTKPCHAFDFTSDQSQDLQNTVSFVDLPTSQAYKGGFGKFSCDCTCTDEQGSGVSS